MLGMRRIRLITAKSWVFPPRAGIVKKEDLIECTIPYHDAQMLLLGSTKDRTVSGRLF